MKLHPVRTEFLLADGQTDMTKLIVAFRNFGKAIKNRSSHIWTHGMSWNSSRKIHAKVLRKQQQTFN